MPRNYYCLVAGLPDLVIDEKKNHFSSMSLRYSLEEDLHPADFELVKLFFLSFDHDNLLNLIFKSKGFDGRGNFSKSQLEELLDKKNFEQEDFADFPPYFTSLVEKVLFGDDKVERHTAELELVLGYNDYVNGFKNSFLEQYITYDADIKNVLIALNGRKFDKEIDTELIGDTEVTAALKKSRARDFGLSNEISSIENIIQIFEMENLLDRELKLDQLKWDYLDEITFFNYFTIERILAFVVKFLIVERWLSLTEETGREMFNKFVTELESGFEIPEEFKLSHGKK